MSTRQPTEPPPSKPRPPEVEGKLRQFHRLLMSYIDFQQAAQISSHILLVNLYAKYPRENRVLLRALNCAAIVAYCRPFSGNDSRADLPISDLPARFLRTLTAEERPVHDTVVADRNEALAHSDSGAWQMDPIILRVRGGELLVPRHRDVHAPLTREAMTVFNQICIKLREAVFREREALEPELRPYLRVVEVDEDELARTAADLGIKFPPRSSSE